MRNLKKFLAVVVAIAVMMTAMIPAFAADTTTTKTDADICKNLKVLTGGTDGVTPEYLAKDTQRIQAAIILLRLLGKEAEAKAFDATGKETFKDAGKVQYAEGKNILAYLKAHPEYGFKGYKDGNFGVEDTMLPQQLYKVLLQAMGYAQDTDYKYAEIAKFAESKGLAKIASLEGLTNNDVAVGIVEAFKGTEKGGKKFVEKLIADKLVDEAAAAAEGLVTITSATSATVKATGAKKLTVEFNGPIDDTKAVFAVAKGAISISIAKKTVAADKKSAVLELASKLTAGDYTATVTGITKDAMTAKVTAADEKIDSIEFTGDKAVIVRDGSDKSVKVSYKAYNQYKEDITDTAALSATVGRGTTTGPSKGSITITDNNTAFKADEKFSASLLDTVNNTFKAGTFTVTANSRVDAITIEKIYNTSDNTKVLTADATAGNVDFALIIKAKDQYGSDIAAPANVNDKTYLNNDIAVSISDSSIAGLEGTPDNYNFKKVSIDGTDYIGLALKSPFKAGKTVVTMISKTTGKLATFTVEVKDTAKVDSFSISAPAVAAAGTKIEVPFEAVDQFGNKLTKAIDLNGGFNSKAAASSTGATIPFTTPFVQDYVKGTAKLIVDAQAMTAKGTITLTFVTSTYKVINLKIDVTDPLAAASVAGYSTDFTPSVVKDASTTLKYSYLKIKDQYAQDYDPNAKSVLSGVATEGNIRITVASSDKAKVALSGSNYNATDDVYMITSSSETVTLTGKAKGSATITVKLQKYNASKTKWEDVSGSDYAFTSKVTEMADITSFDVPAFTKVYNTDPTRGSDLKVNGKLADGTVVVVDASHYKVVTGNANIEFNEVTGKVYSNATGITIVSDKDTADVLVTVIVEGATETKIFTPTLTVDKRVPEATTLTVADSNGVVTKESDSVVSVVYTNVGDPAELQTVVAQAVKCVDQYGSELADNGIYKIIVTNYTTSRSSAPSITGNNTTNPTFVPEKGDTFMVTAITNNKSITFKVVLRES